MPGHRIGWGKDNYSASNTLKWPLSAIRELPFGQHRLASGHCRYASYRLWPIGFITSEKIINMNGTKTEKDNCNQVENNNKC